LEREAEDGAGRARAECVMTEAAGGAMPERVVWMLVWMLQVTLMEQAERKPGMWTSSLLGDQTVQRWRHPDSTLWQQVRDLPCHPHPSQFRAVA